MSRIGKNPINVPDGVKIDVGGGRVSVEGPKGSVGLHFPDELTLAMSDDGKSAVIDRCDNSKKAKSLHGTFRRIVGNMVTGVVTPFERELEIHGVGYQARLGSNKKTKKPEVHLQVGYANTVAVSIPEGVTVEVPSNTAIKVSGADKCTVGQTAANIRAVRPPEPYNGKGIRYKDERVQKRQGKSFVSSD